MTARATWKHWEWRVGRDLGGKRIPVTGVDRDAADVVTPMFHVQCKLRRSLPSWLWAWVSGICMDADPGKVGVLLLKRPGERDREALVVMRYGDFLDLHGTDQGQRQEE